MDVSILWTWCLFWIQCCFVVTRVAGTPCRFCKFHVHENFNCLESFFLTFFFMDTVLLCDIFVFLLIRQSHIANWIRIFWFTPQFSAVLVQFFRFFFPQKVNLLLICLIWMIKLFMNRGQIRLLNSKTTDLDWNCSKLICKLKFLIPDLLFMPFVKKRSGVCAFYFAAGVQSSVTNLKFLYPVLRKM